MKVLLVGPKSNIWTSPELLPLGLAYLAAVLEQAGHDISLYDAVAEEEPLEPVLDRGFDLVGITAVTPLIKPAWEVAAQAKARAAVTVLGGPHPTLLPHESLAQPAVDLVVRGEGEDTILEICRALERLAASGKGLEKTRGWDSALAGIPGLSYKKSDGQIAHNPGRPLRHDLDGLPFPAYHRFKIQRYSNLQPLTDGIQRNPRAVTILTSRGCPYSCIYCSKSVEGHTWRPRSVDSVIQEWRWLVQEVRVTEIGVADDVFNLKLDRAKEICRRLIDEGLNTVPWVTIHGIRADHTDLELFQLMKKAGCKRVGFGVESGNQAILDSIKKHQTIDDVRSAFRNAKKAGLATMGFFMFGLPGETAQTMDDTIDLALELDPEMANFMITAPFPGTELYDIVKKDGRLFSLDWSDYAIHDDRARFEIGTVTAELVERKWHEAYRRFYLRPSRVLQKALRPDTWKNLPRYVGTAQRLFVNRGKHAPWA